MIRSRARASAMRAQFPVATNANAFERRSFANSRALKHAEHDGADKREGDIRGQYAQVADERTKGHPPLPSSRHDWPCSRSKVATRFSAKKSDLLSMRRTIVVKES